jgi:hypothetical protein
MLSGPSPAGETAGSIAVGAKGMGAGGSSDGGCSGIEVAGVVGILRHELRRKRTRVRLF